ncbi:MAG: DUF2807 domain-containing protein, partial [Treponema sp.]|nr:DUF2807 domain-containing protein [Treponema sp.]
GNADDMELVISGFGNFNAGEFRTNNAVVQISGSGRINIWAEETLKANVSGSGRLIYRGNPKIDYRGSGSGRLERV